jgi:hypothetical protein
MKKNLNREDLNDLGIAYGRMQAAHYMIRANLAAGHKWGVDNGAIQLFQAIDDYTKVLDEALKPTVVKSSKASAEEMTARIRSKIVGRIRNGEYVKAEE